VIVTVASGKGGTGKTTVAVSLALSLAEIAPLFLDCDVEEPNAALFLRPVIQEQREVGQMIRRWIWRRVPTAGAVRRCASTTQSPFLGKRCLFFLSCATAAGVVPSTARQERSTRCSM
jgi:MinD superfamily P-loop ATPase